MTFKQHIIPLILILSLACYVAVNQYAKIDQTPQEYLSTKPELDVNPSENKSPKKDSSEINLISLKHLKNSKNPLVIRTYFNKNSDWKAIKTKINQTYILGFRAYVDFLDNQYYDKLEPSMFKNDNIGNYKHHFIFLADSITFSNPEHPIICVDLMDEIGRSFRVIPSEMWNVENNLTISNTDYYEFYNDCDQDGIFRGY